MHLADFILRDMEPILIEWEAFAASLLAAATNKGPVELRDHAQSILHAIVNDLRSSQTREAQQQK